MVAEAIVKFKKNVAAKLATVIASATALGGLWAIVHTNPPASAGTQPAETPASSAPVTGSNSSASRAAAPTPAPTQRKHTRTRAS